MSRSSVRKAKLDGMRRKSKDAKPDYLSPRKNGNRLKGELKKVRLERSSQSHKKRP